ncbi:MAG: nitroreductase family protein [Desulfosalsimonadaceae bacterium]
MFMDLIRRRRSVRKYRQQPVENEKIDQLIEAALRAFSSRNTQPWEIIVVTDPETLARLSEARPKGLAFIKEAPLAIVICADPSKTDVWVEDASIAAAFVHLAATDMGLGSCWGQIRLRHHDEDQSAGAYVSGLLGIREGLEVESIIAAGYPAEEKEPHKQASLQYDKISREKYGQNA